MSELWGVDATTADHAAAALAILEESGQDFDIAVLDYHMPGMDGLELASRIVDHPTIATPALVLLTSSGLVEDRDRAREIGVDAFLTKPILQAALYDTLVGTAGRGTPSPEMITESTLVAATPGHGARLLVVEDNPVNQKVAERLLNVLGHQAMIVNNGVEAVEAVTRNTYDAVLMDCQMPVMDGYTATSTIRRAEAPTHRIPIIAMTAAATSSDIDRCRAAGMDDHIAKPIQWHDLTNVLARWINVPDPGPTTPSAAPLRTPPVLDPNVLTELRDLTGGAGSAEFQDLLDTFTMHTAERLRRLHDAVDAADHDAVAAIGHSLRGSCANFGAERMAQRCADIEAAAMAGEPLPDDTAAGLEAEHELVQDALRAVFHDPPSDRSA